MKRNLALKIEYLFGKNQKTLQNCDCRKTSKHRGCGKMRALKEKNPVQRTRVFNMAHSEGLTHNSLGAVVPPAGLPLVGPDCFAIGRIEASNHFDRSVRRRASWILIIIKSII